MTAEATSGWTIDTLKEYLETLRAADQELARSSRASEQEAVRTALTSAKELATAHNGLLRRMELQGETFATKEHLERRCARLESWQGRMTGGVLVLAAIGVANLVKIWT